MSYPLGMSDRFENGRTRNQNAPSQDEPSLFSFFDPPSQPTNQARPSLHTSTLSDARASLQRRFTTTNLPTAAGLPPIGQPRMQPVENQGADLSFSVYHDSQLRERKQAEYEFIKKKRLQFQQDMLALERKEQLLRSDLETYGPGNQSEPATPPERFENGFPSALSRPNRFSTSSVISPIGTSTRTSRTGSQVNSPPSERDRAYQALTGIPPQMPGARDSGEEEDDQYEDEVLNFDHRKAASEADSVFRHSVNPLPPSSFSLPDSLNRNSMPVTRRDHGVRNGIADSNSVLGHVNTTAFLFGDEYKKSEDLERTPTSKNLPTFLQMHTNDEKFPILIRRDGDGAVDLGASSSDALDLASSQAQDLDIDAGGWPLFARHSSSSQSYSVSQSENSDSPPHGFPLPSLSGHATPTRSTAPNRHSMGARIGPSNDSKRSSLQSNPADNAQTALPPAMPSAGPKLHPSFSTSSVPTMNSMNSGNKTPPKHQIPANVTAEQRLHNHNVSLGRIPQSAIGSNRQSRDISVEPPKTEEQQISEIHSPPAAAIQANAHAYGLGNAGSTSSESPQSAVSPGGGVSSFATQPFYGYSMQPGMQAAMQPNLQMLSNSMNNLQLQSATQQQWPAASLQMYPPQQFMGYTPFQPINPPRFPDNQGRGMPPRRSQHGDDSSRFQNIALENLQGEIHGLCKDQHGCRYLQKKLEERKPEHIQMIFMETKDHMIELMTDPFGNYLCQKLLEFTNDEQRTELINSASPDMVNIALNQHGTRALQKMIEFVSTPTQIQTVIMALKHNVVQMIQDLNGNHVIQKCLNRLSAADAQFIFDAVAAHCVTVGTHRHGCCVIQRCIDHASGHQKAQLVSAISSCSMDLVQDPFGNYVLQYIFDLEEPSFSHPLCRTFLGQVPRLSKQKFSSNVIEKCIRIADESTRHEMISEIVHAPDFEKLADDPFANYVVQTAWDNADPADEAQLAEKIRPLLQRMRTKPYGRRFQNKVTERDKKLGITTSGTQTPNEMSSPDSMGPSSLGYTSPYSQYSLNQESGPLQGSQNNFGNYRNPSFGFQAPNYGSNFGQTQHNRMANGQMPAYNQYQNQGPPAQQQQQQQQQQQPYAPFNRGPQHGTHWY